MKAARSTSLFPLKKKDRQTAPHQMAATRQKKVSFFFCAFILLCAVIFHILGCTYGDRLLSIGREKDALQSYSAEAITLERGNLAFQNKDYEKALEIYRMLSELARDEGIRKKALYGLACTRLILATTPEELSESIILLDAWTQLDMQEAVEGYSLFLEPLLLQKGFPDKKEKMPDVSSELEHTIAGQEKEILLLKRRIKEMEKENEKLNHQLNSLEDIDKDIKKKMKELE